MEKRKTKKNLRGRLVSKKEFVEFLKETSSRHGAVSVIDNEDGSKTVMIDARNKHAGTFTIRSDEE